MEKLNFEFKARVQDLARVREQLRTLNVQALGTDRQRDTYFDVPEGRLKLREGKIENALIFYRRSDDASARESRVEIAGVTQPEDLRRVLVAALPVTSVVEKEREIYFAGETKIHLDTIENVGHFLEVEASNPADAQFFFRFFNLKPADLEGRSYSDFAGLC